MSSTNQLNSPLNGFSVGSGSQSSSGTSSAPNLFLGPSSSAATNPAAVNWTSSAGINGNNSRGIVTTAVASTGQIGGSNTTEERLPEGWELRFDTYYVNGTDNLFSRERPSNQPLPTSWEMRRDTRGWIYYFDHSTCSTTWQRPTADMLEAHAQWQSGRDQAMQYWGQRFLLQVGPIEMTGMERLFERTFRWKIAQFRYRCLSNSTPNFVKITVSRTNVFEDSFQEIMNKNPLDLRRRLYIEFRNEEQDASQISYETSNPEEERLDYDGVAREWFFLVSHEMLNPVRYLFMCAGNNNNSLQINPASFVNPDHLQYFEFIGKLIAMALFHGKFIHSGFMMPFYKKMLNKRIMLKDIEQVDFDLYNRMTWIKNNNIDERPMNLYFLDDYELRGEWKTHELKPGGAETLVTEATKDEYIDLFIQWRFNRGVEQQTQAFVNGFYSVFPLEWLQNFDERELELLLCGMQDVDVDDWESNTVHRGYAPQDEQLTWFWQWVRSLNQERHARLLQFVTGTCRVLVGGFSELMGSTGPQLFCIERVDGEDRLPRSRTCFNQLDLPPYRNYAHLAETLTAAIDNTEGFGNE